ncbi:protein LYRIC-like isoform X3 [Channa argus]|uniref:protein LYRIC-like isoform X3 n=1 Tax=Channa argus TaxID=215402 RepID=UPI0035211F24
MEQWHDAASQQVKMLTKRVNDLLSKGLELLRSELGVDLGLKPELIPPWVILLATCTGLVLMLVLWASVYRALFKKRPASSHVDDGIDIKRGVSNAKPIKHEEPKKKKKRAEKVKKSKKKAKMASKETKTVPTDGKEPEEGTWETKVSNKEKREQRKKDKSSSDGSASPGGGDTPVSAPQEQPKATSAPGPGNQKKKKESTKVKAEKVEAPVSQVNNSEVPSAKSGVNDMILKVPAHSVAPKTDPWAASRESASLWRAESDDSWTLIDRPTAELTMSFTGLGVGAAEPQPVSDLPWLSQPSVGDEWSGLNGGSVDPSSDWNPPSEVWGNYEEPTPEPPPSQEQPLTKPAKANLLIEAVEEEEDEKEKVEPGADGAAKTKKKKKKKKKTLEEGGAPGQGDEPGKQLAPAASVKKQTTLQENTAALQPVKAAAVELRVERPMKENISQKPSVTQVPQKPIDGDPMAKQNNLPAPTQQKKPEESQAPKPAKKKKARRET